MSKKLASRLAELAEAFRQEHEGSLEGVTVKLELVLYDICQLAELTPEQVSQVLSGDMERVLAVVERLSPAREESTLETTQLELSL